MPTVTPVFQTPPRILIPKLLRSRDGWKAKAAARTKLLKAARIRNRDLEASRNAWKAKAQAAEQRVAELQDRVDHLEQSQRLAASAEPEDGPKKVSTSN
jgi:chromosome segregation ATPase